MLPEVIWCWNVYMLSLHVIATLKKNRELLRLCITLIYAIQNTDVSLTNFCCFKSMYFFLSIVLVGIYFNYIYKQKRRVGKKRRLMVICIHPEYGSRVTFLHLWFMVSFSVIFFDYYFCNHRYYIINRELYFL